jgi:hypothetical protein
MQGTFVALHHKVKDHKRKAKKLLDEEGCLSYEIHSLIGAIIDARQDWDDEVTAFYAVELCELVGELLLEKSQN